MKRKEFIARLVDRYVIACKLEDMAREKYYKLSLAERETLSATKDKYWDCGYYSAMRQTIMDLAQELEIKEALTNRLQKKGIDID